MTNQHTAHPSLVSFFLKKSSDFRYSKESHNQHFPANTLAMHGRIYWDDKDVGRQVTSLVLIMLLYKGLELTLKFFFYSSGAAVYSSFLSLHPTQHFSWSYFCCIGSTRKSNTRKTDQCHQKFSCGVHSREWGSLFGVKVLGRGKPLGIPTLEARHNHSLGRYPCVWVLHISHLIM